MKIIKDSENYTCKVFKVKDYTQHENASKLWCIIVDYQRVITGIEPKIGDIMIYFPVLSKINKDFLSQINAFSNKELNKDKKKVGFFSDSGRVKPIKLRGLSSEGYIHPLKDVEEFLKVKLNVGDEFNECNGIILCDKYIIKKIKTKSKGKEGKKPKESRLVENQFRLSIDIEHLKRNMQKLNLDDYISLTRKMHGCNSTFANILVKRRLNWKEKLAKKLGIKIQETEYDIVIGSRRIIKNGTTQGFYKNDVWSDQKEVLKDKILPGITLYCELVNQTKSGEWIQRNLVLWKKILNFIQKKYKTKNYEEYLLRLHSQKKN